ncbi:MAG TPA: hypothetical protein VEF34_08830 [Syntrophobacteraceae bacterium]|nr:hypothetical protein [Syntrophobacteraceae bacterium]
MVEGRIYHRTSLGEILLGDALEILDAFEDDSVNLIMTSPPFGLVRKKQDGNVNAPDHIDWFRPNAANLRKKAILSRTYALNVDG